MFKYIYNVSYVGPSKSALKAMLVNLDNDEGVPPLQSGSVSPPGHAATSGIVDIHLPDAGECLNHTEPHYFFCRVMPNSGWWLS